jgi:hypothetical protein
VRLRSVGTPQVKRNGTRIGVLELSCRVTIGTTGLTSQAVTRALVRRYRFRTRRSRVGSAPPRTVIDPSGEYLCQWVTP